MIVRLVVISFTDLFDNWAIKAVIIVEKHQGFLHNVSEVHVCALVNILTGMEVGST